MSEGFLKKNFFARAFGSILKPEDEVIKTLNVGDAFGESALKDKKPLLYTIVAKEDCFFATIVEEDYNNVIDEQLKKNRYKQRVLIENFPSVSLNNMMRLTSNFNERQYKKGDFIYR